jgi:pimeloyl-ACP methyl ester carboxylesterase
MAGIHKGSHGRGDITPSDEGTSMASSMGPSLAELQTQTVDGESYPTSIRYTHDFANIMHMAGYYRDGTSVARWRKSLETVANLHRIAGGYDLQRANSRAGLLDKGTPGALQASSTVLWGEQDVALNPPICLDGMADLLVADSQIVMLTESGHFTPIEQESRVALVKAVEWAIHGEQGDIGAVIQECYPSAKVIARR